MPRGDATRLGRRWSTKHERCVKCKRTTVAHMAQGMCGTCYKGRYAKEVVKATYIGEKSLNYPTLKESRALCARATIMGSIGLLSDETLKRFLEFSKKEVKP